MSDKYNRSTKGDYSREQLRILRLVAERVFQPHFKPILDEWIKSFGQIDAGLVFSQAEFGDICRRILTGITNALATGRIDAGLEEIARLSSVLASARFPFARVPEFIHLLEDGYNPILLGAFRDSPDLTLVVMTLDEFLHQVLEVIAESYFDKVRADITEELAIGRILESAFRPRLAPQIRGLDIGIVYRSATEAALVGGDFYDFFFLPDGRLAVALGDVSGKGVEAATTAAMTKYMLRAFAFETDNANEILDRLNRALVNLTAPNEFISAALALYDPKTGRLDLAGAGHPPGVYRPRDGDPRFVEMDGAILGVSSQLSSGSGRIDLGPGDMFLLYTDGLTEARAGSRFFGFDRLLQAVGDMASAARCQDIVDRLFSACERFAGGKLLDDIAIVALRRDA